MIAVLGAGKMGEALTSGLLRAGTPPAEVVAAVRREDRAVALREAYGIEVLSAAEAAGRAAMEGAVGYGHNDYKLALGQQTVVRALMQAKAMPAPGPIRSRKT